MKRLLLASAGLAALALSGCETMTPEECAVADWRAVGYSDGADGSHRFEARQQSCAKAGFGADFDAYMAGRAEGLRAYCVPEAGFRRALNGTGYNGQCPADLAPEYVAAHSDGYRAYQVLSALRSKESEIDRLYSDLRNIDADINKRERELQNDKLNAQDREWLRNEIRRLDRERRRVNDDIVVTQSEVRRYADDVDRTRYEIGDRWGAW